MNYLAIDTASSALKVLIKHGERRKYFQSDDFKSASESLLPVVDRLLGELNITLKDLDTLACVIGPGSFTGIRIGMSSVKAIAYALDKKVVAVNSLQLLAYNNTGADTVIAAVDAGNGYRYTAVYDGNAEEIMPPKCLLAEEFDGFIGMVDEPYAFFSDASAGGKIPSKESFMRAMEKAVDSGVPIHFNDIEPLYIRKPQAERDLENK